MSVFISHSEADETVARELSRRLHALGVAVWDEKEVLPGDNLALKLGKALEKSEAVIVLLSPSALKSRLVRSEIQFALGSKKLQNRLLPVVVRPVRERQIPWILRKFNLLSLIGDPVAGSRRVAKALRQIEIDSAPGR